MARNVAMQFFRRHVAGPGKSVHNGRGAYEMEFEGSDSEIWSRLIRVLDKHRDKIDHVKFYSDPEWGEQMVITPIAAMMPEDQYYCTLCVHWAPWGKGANTINLSILM